MGTDDEYLEDRSIETRPILKPMHLQPVFRGHRTLGGTVSGALFETGLCLPSGSNLESTDLERIAGAIHAARRAKVP